MTNAFFAGFGTAAVFAIFVLIALYAGNKRFRG